MSKNEGKYHTGSMCCHLNAIIVLKAWRTDGDKGMASGTNSMDAGHGLVLRGDSWGGARRHLGASQARRNKNCNSTKGRPNRPQYCCICHGTSTRSCTWRGNECRSSSQRWTCIWHRLVKWWRSRRQEWTEQTLKLNCDSTRDLWSQLGNKRGRLGQARPDCDGSGWSGGWYIRICDWW